MVKFLFLDMDDTILDFKKAERIALEKTLSHQGITPSEEVCELYSKINMKYWQMLERGELTREQVMTGRFEELFRQLCWDADAEDAAQHYMEYLGIGHYFLPGAYEALLELSRKYPLYLASNGTAKVQHGRLDSADMRHLFRDIFISEEMGANKPALAFFQSCFARIPDFDPACAMIVGDSLTSDILGGKNAGIATCWVNPQHKSPRPDIQPDYQIEALSQLPALLDTL